MKFPMLGIASQDIGIHVSFGMMQVAAWLEANPDRTVYGIESVVEHYAPNPEKPKQIRERHILVIYFDKASAAKAN